MHFFADAIYFAIIFISYKDVLIENLNDIENKTGRKLSYVLIGFVFILFANLLFSFIPWYKNNMIGLEYGKYYLIFKMLIFSVIAEELLFKQTIRELINIDWLFIIISSLIYAFVTIIYSDLLFISTWITFLWCFVVEAFLAFIYVKQENIIVPMTSKFLYNLIKVVLVASGAGLL